MKDHISPTASHLQICGYDRSITCMMTYPMASTELRDISRSLHGCPS